jgi:acetyltransferase-like isoleucine patch superfamily enzyme
MGRSYHRFGIMPGSTALVRARHANNSAVILGDVKVGKHTRIGPNVVLDGLGGALVIGDFCALSAGVEIYTHHTVRWCQFGSGGEDGAGPTAVGNGVYIGPNSVIAMGITIGDSVVIGAMSFVNQNIPARKKAWGCPATVVGDIGRTALSHSDYRAVT